MNDPSPEQPETRLRRFIEAMEQWENETWKAMKQAERTSDPNSYQPAARQRLTSIFEEFCTTRRGVRGRLEDLMVANPSDYCTSQLSLKEQQITARKAVFASSSAKRGIAARFVYILLNQDGRWLVDKKQTINDDGSITSWWI